MQVLAIRLAPYLKDLVSTCQSAFIKKRCIQDNFLYVNNVIKEAHRKKQPLIFLKLDIAKAFDVMGWPYLLKVMKVFGRDGVTSFPFCWPPQPQEFFSMAFLVGHSGT